MAYNIALIPGDGIGKEVVPVKVKLFLKKFAGQLWRKFR